MSYALKIVAVIAIYSVAEAILLTTWAVAAYLYPTSGSWQLAVFFGQSLFIPGLAATFSRIMFGPDRWHMRLLVYLGFGLLVPFATCLTVLVVAVLFPNAGSALFISAFLLIASTITFALRFLIRRMRTRSVELEAARWLAERESRIDPAERRWPNRGIRLALWIPAVTVLFTCLFLPEACGVLSHLYQRQSGMADLYGYQIPVPLTWILLSQPCQLANDDCWISGFAGKGMARSPRHFLHAGLLLSHWDIRIPGYAHISGVAHTVSPAPREQIGTRTLAIGDESITCAEYWPRGFIRPLRVEGSTPIYVDCAGSKRLYAGFVGETADLPAFYKMLENTVRH
jgi:hypothetical protein